MDTILENRDFGALLQRHAKEILLFLLDKKENFSVLTMLEFVKFDPALPEHLMPKSNKALFALGNYTLQSAYLQDGNLIFHTGFGDENFASFVSVPLHSILAISIEGVILFCNPGIASSVADKQNQIEKSKNIFKSNPQNQKYFK